MYIQYEYSYCDPSEAEIAKCKFALGGVVLLLVLLLMLLLVQLPVLLLLLLLLRFRARRASEGAVLQLRCCCDVALVLRPYYSCSFHTSYIHTISTAVHMTC